MTKKIYLAILLALLLTGCGGGVTNTSEYTGNNIVDIQDEGTNPTNTTSIDFLVTTSTATDDEKTLIENRHNYYRNLIPENLPELVWDDELGAHAQTWANYLAGNMTTEEREAHVSPHATSYQTDKHTEDDYFEGENIAWTTAHTGYVNSSVIDTAEEYNNTRINTERLGSVDAWASEAFYYDNNIPNTVTGHYTQIVWKDTTKVGCGKGLSTKDTYFNGIENVKIEWVVCRYSTPGNIIGQDPY